MRKINDKCLVRSILISFKSLNNRGEATLQTKHVKNFFKYISMFINVFIIKCADAEPEFPTCDAKASRISCLKCDVFELSAITVYNLNNAC